MLTAHERHSARPGGPHGEAVDTQGPLRPGAARDRRERPPPERRRLRAGRNPLPAHARQRRRDPRKCRGRRGGRPDRGFVHRLRGGRVADDARQALHDRDAGAGRPSNAASAPRPGRFFQDAARSARRGRPRRGGAGPLRGRRPGGLRCITGQRPGAPRPAVVIGAGVTPDLGLAQRAGLEIGELGGVRCDSRLESSARASSPPGTSANTSRSSTAAGGSASSTGTSPSTRARLPR